MRTEDYPIWIAGRLPTSSSGNVALPAAPSNTFRQGKKQVQKIRAKSDERKVTMQWFIRQLDRALVGRARELDAIHEVEATQSNLVDAACDFFSLAIRLNDETTNHRGKTPPKTLSNARALQRRLESLKVRSASFVPEIESELKLHTVLNELFEDVDHFVRSIEMTHATVTVIDGVPQLRNRQRNLEAMTAFCAIVQSFRGNGARDGLPRTSIIKSRLRNMGHEISERTIRDWKQQFEANTFGDFVQKRKRQ